MAGLLPGDPSHHGMVESGPYHFTREKHEDSAGSRWYFSRKEIEENSPSRRDGIDLKKETYFRKSYCTFLQDLGMRLKVPQVTIATAIIFCHRFFLRQSHAKNERRTIATVCMFLAGKVEETPRPLKDVILVSYEIIHKKDPSAVQKIKQKEVYEEQKELILLGERVVLATLGFDLNLQHPYKPLVEAIKKFKVAQNALAQVAWNFVNDGLRTSLCLQFKPHHIAAGAIFLAAKFLKVKLPSDGEKFWWQEFDVTPRQLEEVSNQMLELYEQNRNVQSSHGSEVEGSMGSAANQRSSSKAPASEEPVPTNTCSQVGSVSVKHGSSVTSSAHTGSGQSFVDNDTDTHKATKTQVLDGGPVESRGGTRQKVDCASAEMDSFPSIRDHNAENPNRSKFRSERTMNDGKRKEMGEVLEEKEWKDEGCLHLSNSTNVRNSGNVEGPKGYCPQDVITKIDKDKVKAALEKRKKFRGDLSRNTDMMDEDDLIERELENGIELAAEDDKNKDRALHSKSLNRSEVDNVLYDKEQHENTQGKKFVGMEYQSTGRTRPGPVDKGAIMDPYAGSHISNENIEEGELSLPDCSPRFVSRNEKGAGVEKYRHDYSQHPYGYSNRQESSKDANRSGGRLDHVEREHKRHRHESHV